MGQKFVMITGQKQSSTCGAKLAHLLLALIAASYGHEKTLVFQTNIWFAKKSD